MIKYYESVNNFLLSDWIKYIKKKNCNNNFYSLHRVMIVAKKLNLLNNSNFIITVTGTNGKGSTCFLLEKIFLYSGYNVGLYTSPHLLHYYERIRINGKYIQDPHIHITVFREIEKIRGQIFLNYFEFITIAALLIFKMFNLDILILEVGIGGRLDATNIMNANMAIITNIDLDHILLLGKNRNDIGCEKSGIFRKRISVIIGEINIPYSVYVASNFLKVSLKRVLYEWNWYQMNQFWNFYDDQGSLQKLYIPKILLSNAAISIAAVRATHFNITIQNIQKALKNIFLPGRFHTILYKPRVILDVAHNPHAAYALYKELQILLSHTKYYKVYCIIGMILNKDIKKFISILLNIIDIWCYAPLKTSKGISINILKKYLPNRSRKFYSVSHALSSLIQEVNKKDIILVLGSFYTVSEALIFFNNYYMTI